MITWHVTAGQSRLVAQKQDNSKEIFPPTHTIIVTHLTYQQLVHHYDAVQAENRTNLLSRRPVDALRVKIGTGFQQWKYKKL